MSAIVIDKTPTRRLTVTLVEMVGQLRVAVFEEELRGKRWAPTSHGFTIDPSLIPQLVGALQGLRGAE